VPYCEPLELVTFVDLIMLALGEYKHVELLIREWMAIL
jgi:hypothetical protein